MSPQADEVRLEFPSRFEFLSVLNSVAEEMAQQMGFDEEALNAITISVVEAGTNAIQHGHQEDPNKITRVLFRKEENRLVVVVRDEGGGFDPSQLGNPVAKENLFAESGRGVYILRSFMDEVDFRFPEGATGTECQLVKYLPR
ncbi:MAG: ATP-binding protein [Gemmatimonadetes bacterium]|nr:ATP-binding protein [Gemmatimonadota bacterium]